MAGLDANPLVVIRVLAIVVEVFCALTVDTVDDTRIKNKITDMENRIIEYNFLLVIIHFPLRLSLLFCHNEKNASNFSASNFISLQ